MAVGISVISSPLAAAAAAAGGIESTSCIAASLLSLSIMATLTVVHYDILQRGGREGARQQPTGLPDDPCQRHAPAPRQIEAISTITYQPNQTCYIYIFNWCVCSEGRVKGPLAVKTLPLYHASTTDGGAGRRNSSLLLPTLARLSTHPPAPPAVPAPTHNSNAAHPARARRHSPATHLHRARLAHQRSDTTTGP